MSKGNLKVVKDGDDPDEEDNTETLPQKKEVHGVQIDPEKEKGNRYPTEEIIKKIIEAKGNVTVAASFLDCSRRTIHARVQDYPEIRDVIRDQRMKRKDLAKHKLLEAIEDGQPWAIKYELNKNKSQDELEKLIEDTQKNQNMEQMEEFDEVREALKSMTNQGDSEEEDEQGSE